MTLFIRGIGLLVLIGLVAGCSETVAPLDLYPVTGVVLREGKPVKGGGLILQSVDETKVVYSVSASVTVEGQFTAETFRTFRNGKTTNEAGAPPGKYKAIYHPPSNGSKMGLEMPYSDIITIEPKPNMLKIDFAGPGPKGLGEVRDDDPPSKD